MSCSHLSTVRQCSEHIHSSAYLAYICYAINIHLLRQILCQLEHVQASFLTPATAVDFAL